MKNRITAALMLVAASARAQLDRGGNVIDDDGGGGGGGGSGFGVVLGGMAIGATIGIAWAKYQQSQGKEFAADGGAIIGGLIGMLAGPLLFILFK